MSTTIPAEVGCPNCGTRQTILIAESANVQRSPSWKRAAHDGTLHKFLCDTCGLDFRVERDLLYSDLHGGILIGAFAPTRRPEVVQLEADIAETWVQTVEVEAPPVVARYFKGPGPRVVFGLAALREKVVCFDARLDDRLIEAVKLALLEGIAGRAEAGVTDLILVEVQRSNELMLLQPVGADGVAAGDELLQIPFAMYRDFESTRNIITNLLPQLFEGLWVHWSRSRPDGLLGLLPYAAPTESKTHEVAG